MFHKFKLAWAGGEFCHDTTDAGSMKVSKGNRYAVLLVQPIHWGPHLNVPPDEYIDTTSGEAVNRRSKVADRNVLEDGERAHSGDAFKPMLASGRTMFD